MKTGVLTRAGLTIGAGVVIGLAGCNGGREPVADLEPVDAVVQAEAATVEDAIENQRLCPVMEGMPIDKNIYVDHDGKRVYFCCAGCVSAFEADPEKYMEKLTEIHADPDHEPDPAEHEHDHDHVHDQHDH